MFKKYSCLLTFCLCLGLMLIGGCSGDEIKGDNSNSSFLEGKLAIILAFIGIAITLVGILVSMRRQKTKEIEELERQKNNEIRELEQQKDNEIKEFEKKLGHIQGNLPDGYQWLNNLNEFIETGEFQSGPDEIIAWLQNLEHYFGQHRASEEDNEIPPIHPGVVKLAHEIIPKLCIYEPKSLDASVQTKQEEIREKAFNCYSRIISHLPNRQIDLLIENIKDWTESQQLPTDVKEGAITIILTPALQRALNKREDLLDILRSFWNNPQADSKTWIAQVRKTISSLSVFYPYLEPQEICDFLLDSWHEFVISDREIIESNRIDLISAWNNAISSVIDVLDDHQKDQISNKIGDWLHRHKRTSDKQDVGYAQFTEIMRALRNSRPRPINRTIVEVEVEMSLEGEEDIRAVGKTEDASPTGAKILFERAKIEDWTFEPPDENGRHYTITINNNGNVTSSQGYISLLFTPPNDPNQQIVVSQALIRRVIDSDVDLPPNTVWLGIEFVSDKAEYEKNLENYLLETSVKF